jgi:hypothetical protein
MIFKGAATTTSVVKSLRCIPELELGNSSERKQITTKEAAFLVLSKNDGPST